MIVYCLNTSLFLTSVGLQWHSIYSAWIDAFLRFGSSVVESMIYVNSAIKSGNTDFRNLGCISSNSEMLYNAVTDAS
jgi:hypothetical protein